MNGKKWALVLAASALAALALIHWMRARDEQLRNSELPRDAASGAQPVLDGSSTAPAKSPAEPDLRLVFVTDLEGELAPCGCTKGQLGGVDRLGSAIEMARGRGGPTFVVAAGNLFQQPSALKPQQRPTAQRNWSMDTFADVLRHLPLSAAGIGDADLALGHARLSELSARADSTWLAAGVTLEKLPDGALPSAEQMATTPADPIVASKLLEAGSLRVGVVGLLERRGAQAASEGTKGWSERVRSQRVAGASFVVALVHGSRAAAEQLANSARPEVVVLTGPEASGHEARQVSSSILLSAGARAEGFVTLELFFAPNGAPWQLRRAERGESCQRGAAQSCALESYQELSSDVPSAPGVRSALERLTLRIKEHNRVAYADALPAPTAEGKPGYVGSRPCAACHTAEYLWWESSVHGHAFASLEKRDKDLDLDCVSCHVTGYGKPGGSTVTHTDHLRNVGCESCHGPGSLHILDARPSQKTMQREVATSVCVSCHDRLHSSAFDSTGYRALLKTSGHG